MALQHLSRKIKKYIELEAELKPKERLENLDISSDFMFFKIMHNADICAELLRRILPDIEIGEIKFPETQKNMHESPDSRSVRLDVYTKSHDGRKIYNIEMQNVNEGNLPKRSRCYHAVMDTNAMNKKTMRTYNDMPEAFVIFICKFDLFHQGRHIYTFKNFCCEDKNIELGDFSQSIFLNAKGVINDVSPELKAFLNLVIGQSSDDPFIHEIEEMIEIARHNSEWRREYMMALMRERETLEKGRLEGRREGLIEGEIKGKIATAKKMFDFGLSVADILKITGLSPEDLNSFIYKY